MVIFKRLLVKNPKVLAQFIKANLGLKEVKLIERMIQPKPKKEAAKQPVQRDEQRQGEMDSEESVVTDKDYKERQFLFEVCIIRIKIHFTVTILILVYQLDHSEISILLRLVQVFSNISAGLS